MASHKDYQPRQVTRLEYLERVEEFPAADISEEDNECCICTEKMQYAATNRERTSPCRSPIRSLRNERSRSPSPTSDSPWARSPRANKHSREAASPKPQDQRTCRERSPLTTRWYSRKAVRIHDQHYCCEHCLASWMRESSSCPLCRQTLFTKMNNGKSLEIRLDNYVEEERAWRIAHSALGRTVKELEVDGANQVVVHASRASKALWHWWWTAFTVRNAKDERHFIHHPVASALLFDMLECIKNGEGTIRGLAMQRFCNQRSIEHRVAFWRENGSRFGDPLLGLDDYVEDLIEAAAQAVVQHCVKTHDVRTASQPRAHAAEINQWIQGLQSWHVRQKAWGRHGQEWSFSDPGNFKDMTFMRPTCCPESSHCHG